MNTETVKILIGLAMSLPAIVSDIEAAVTEYKSSDATEVKITKLVADIEQIINAAVKVV